MQLDEKTQKIIKERKECIKDWMQLFEIDSPIDLAVLTIISSFVNGFYEEMAALHASEMQIVTGADIIRIAINGLRKEIIIMEGHFSLANEPQIWQ